MNTNDTGRFDAQVPEAPIRDTKAFTPVTFTPVTEEELQARAVAPRVTQQAVEDAITAEHYFTAYEGVLGERFVRGAGESDKGEGKVPKTLGLLTFCVLTLKNGYTVVGKSASASFENFDPQIGRRIARGDAVNQIWPLLGYVLRTQLDNLKKISQGNQDLNDALTHLLAHQLGNREALTPAKAATIMAFLEGRATTDEKLSDESMDTQDPVSEESADADA